MALVIRSCDDGANARTRALAAKLDLASNPKTAQALRLHGSRCGAPARDEGDRVMD